MASRAAGHVRARPQLSGFLSTTASAFRLGSYEKTMPLRQELDASDSAKIGREMHAFASELYPICRSITGDGIRETLARIGQRIPLRLTGVPTGAKVLDWTVTKEWNIPVKLLRSRRHIGQT